MKRTAFRVTMFSCGEYRLALILTTKKVLGGQNLSMGEINGNFIAIYEPVL